MFRCMLVMLLTACFVNDVTEESSSGARSSGGSPSTSGAGAGTETSSGGAGAAGTGSATGSNSTGNGGTSTSGGSGGSGGSTSCELVFEGSQHAFDVGQLLTMPSAELEIIARGSVVPSSLPAGEKLVITGSDLWFSLTAQPSSTPLSSYSLEAWYRGCSFIIDMPVSDPADRADFEVNMAHSPQGQLSINGYAAQCSPNQTPNPVELLVGGPTEDIFWAEGFIGSLSHLEVRTDGVCVGFSLEDVDPSVVSADELPPATPSCGGIARPSGGSSARPAIVCAD